MSVDERRPSRERVLLVFGVLVAVIALVVMTSRNRERTSVVCSKSPERLMVQLSDGWYVADDQEVFDSVQERQSYVITYDWRKGDNRLLEAHQVAVPAPPIACQPPASSKPTS